MSCTDTYTVEGTYKCEHVHTWIWILPCANTESHEEYWVWMRLKTFSESWQENTSLMLTDMTRNVNRDSDWWELEKSIDLEKKTIWK